MVVRSKWIMVGLAVFSGCGAPDAPQPDVPVLRLQELSRLGTLEGEGSALTLVAGIALGDSTVLVLESRPARVAVFSYGGEWLRDFGRPGDGPGEFRWPSRLGVVDGEIWVGDPGGRRLEVFLPDGTPSRSYRWEVPPDSLGARAYPSAPLSDGSILAGPGTLSLGAASRGWVTHRSYYRATDAGEVLGEVYREVLASSDFTAGELPGGGIFVGMHPIRESPLVAFYPDGSGLVAVERLAARNPQDTVFRVRVYSAEGNVETDISVPYKPVSAEGWLERHLREIERDMIERSGSANRQMIEALREALTDRPFYPPVTNVIAGADGSIWIRREELAADSVRWDVFRRNGESIGRVPTSAGLSIHCASLDEVWAVERNELDVPFVIRMRVTR